MFKKLSKICKSFAIGFALPLVTIPIALFGGYSDSGLLDVFGKASGTIAAIIIIGCGVTTFWFFGPFGILIGLGSACVLSGIFTMWCSK